MTDHRGDGSRSDGWVLETFQRVHEVLCEATSAGELGEQLVSALSTGPAHRFAWIGVSEDSGVRVRAVPSSAVLPDRLAVTGSSQTRRALDTGETQVATCLETPEGRELESVDSVPAADRLVSIPIQAEDTTVGVLHVHTDREPQETPSVLDDLGTVVGQRFVSLGATRQLERERRRLETFRSMVSHDIGNPLNIASGRIELAEDECDTDHLGHATDALKRVEELIDTGLTFVQVGKPPDERTPISLATMAEQAWEDVGSPRATLQTTDWTVNAERERCRRLLNELFRNAIDHSEGTIQVTVAPLDDGSGFYVADTGPGIPEDEREYVFDLGYSTEPGRDGIGLTVVDEIAGAHGWTARLGPADTRGTRVEIITDNW